MGKYLTKTGLTKYTTKLKEYISKAKVASAASADNAIKVNNHTVNSDVPANAKFTDTDTWRPQPDWNATSGDAVIKNKPTSMPASDVYAWAKASTKPTYSKSEVGLGNVDNIADANKSVKSSTKLQTYKQGSTTETYGDEYPIYAQWENTTNVRLKCDDYTVKTDFAYSSDNANYATTAGSANSVAWSNVSGRPTIPSVENGTVTITQNGTTKGSFTMNQGGNTTIALTDNNTTYGVATSSTLGLVKSGTDITVDSSGNVSVNDDSHNHVISNVDGLQSALDGKSSTGHTHTVVNGVTPEWSGSIAWADTSWISAWNSDGTKIKALDKSSFAPASHTHNYLPLSGGIIKNNAGESTINPGQLIIHNDDGTITIGGHGISDNNADCWHELKGLLQVGQIETIDGSPIIDIRNGTTSEGHVWSAVILRNGYDRSAYCIMNIKMKIPNGGGLHVMLPFNFKDYMYNVTVSREFDAAFWCLPNNIASLTQYVNKGTTEFTIGSGGYVDTIYNSYNGYGESDDTFFITVTGEVPY